MYFTEGNSVKCAHCQEVAWPACTYHPSKTCILMAYKQLYEKRKSSFGLPHFTWQLTKGVILVPGELVPCKCMSTIVSCLSQYLLCVWNYHHHKSRQLELGLLTIFQMSWVSVIYEVFKIVVSTFYQVWKWYVPLSDAWPSTSSDLLFYWL